MLHAFVLTGRKNTGLKSRADAMSMCVGEKGG
jgi:hypothetical protein